MTLFIQIPRFQIIQFVMLLITQTALAASNNVPQQSLQQGAKKEIIMTPASGTITPITINPKPPAVVKETTGFKLRYEKNQLVLFYSSAVPNLFFNPKSNLVIQLLPKEALHIEPVFITQKNWPKGSQQMQIKLPEKEWKKNKNHEITVLASFQACDKAFKNCKRLKSRYLLRAYP